MKFNIINNLAIIAIGALIISLLTSCATSSISMEVLVPAQVNIPQNIKKVVIINRSLPEKQELWKNILEGFVTGESIKADKEGSMNCINGLGNKLNQGPRFTAVVSSNLTYRGTGTRQFAAPLAWEQVNNLCSQYGADAVIALEAFDSDVNLNRLTRAVKKTINGAEVVVNEFDANLRFNVNSGWRVYESVNRKIVEENSYIDYKEWHGSGDTEDKALAGLPSKRDAINESGYYSGEMFAMRISPSWMHTTREYYVRKDAGLKRAKSFVKFNNWDKAMEIWTNLTTMSKDPKVVGRAAYNLAIGFEQKGDLKTALEWANKAYKDFHVKKALYLINILSSRIADQEKLNKQLNNN